MKKKRDYSSTQKPNIPSKNKIDSGSIPIIFDSLEIGYESIKFSLLGVAGVYLLVNKKNPKRFYIGSSVNLARRVQEYIHLIKGIRQPKSVSQEEIKKKLLPLIE